MALLPFPLSLPLPPSALLEVWSKNPFFRTPHEQTWRRGLFPEVFFLISPSPLRFVLHPLTFDLAEGKFQDFVYRSAYLHGLWKGASGNFAMGPCKLSKRFCANLLAHFWLPINRGAIRSYCRQNTNVHSRIVKVAFAGHILQSWSF